MSLAPTTHDLPMPTATTSVVHTLEHGRVLIWLRPDLPEQQRAQFKALYAYSPYQRVKKGAKYPAILFVTGDADTRVAPLHARKMTALMQAANASDEPILLRYHVAAGHSGGEPLHVQVKNMAEELGFFWWQLRQ